VEHHEFFDAAHVVDVHRLPEDLRKLTVFLMLDRLYTDIMALPDAPLDTDGNRQMRLIIVIDEAHHYLPCKQPTLEKMVREVRSKGVGMWLLSQSPDDFDQPKYNFAREMGLSIVFSCVLEKPKMLEAVLGGRVDPKRLSQLGAGVALTRIPGSEAPMEIQAWEP
jgi:DNA sulfur modification protein DndE